jgi:hypothetical protein
MLNPTLGRVARRVLRPNPTSHFTNSFQFLPNPAIPSPLSTPYIILNTHNTKRYLKNTNTSNSKIMKPSSNRKKNPKPHANNTNFESTAFQNNETVTPARHHGKRRAPRLRSSNLKTITHNPKTRKPKDPRTQKPKDPPTLPHPKSDLIRNPIVF